MGSRAGMALPGVELGFGWRGGRPHSGSGSEGLSGQPTELRPPQAGGLRDTGMASRVGRREGAAPTGERRQLGGRWQRRLPRKPEPRGVVAVGGPCPSTPGAREGPSHFQQRSRELWGWILSFWGQSSLVKARRKL